jgi:phosphatidylglycerophosphate synthase
MPSPDPAARRPLKTRQSPFFQRVASTLAHAGIAPNAISFASMLFAGGAAVAFGLTAQSAGWAHRVWWLVAAACIQLRLLANMLDGMVAVEGGRGGPTGDLWNEAPDRVSDTLILVGAGFAAGGIPWLGYGAALMAMFVAYVRALGASVGAGQLFLGPMAKPHRMFTLTVLSVAAALIPRINPSPFGAHVLFVRGCPEACAVPCAATSFALLIILVGGLITAARRLARIAQFLRARSVR